MPLTKIFIYREPGGDDAWATPAEALVERQGVLVLQFRFVGEEGDAATVDLTGVPLAPAQQPVFQVPPPGNPNQPVTVVLDPDAPFGAYSYSVTIHGTAITARPAGDPIIIIHPPEN